MIKQKLDEFACIVLARLGGALAALWELAWLNRRTTAKGVAGAVVFLAARNGFEISPDTQAWLATAIFIYLGLAGRDKLRRRIQ